MRRFVHLWDSWDEFCSGGWFDFGWPVFGYAFVEIYVPLTTNVVADEDSSDKGELKERGSECEIHVSISDAGGEYKHNEERFNKRTFRLSAGSLLQSA